MDGQQRLQGACSCGRYSYVIVVPENDRGNAKVHFRTDDEHRRSQAALLTAFLRIPVAWYSSNTTSFFPDETHHSISRTFSPPEEPHTQRKFCGYCGTHLTYWTEEPQEEQAFLHVTLGSLRNRDLDTLQDLDLLPKDIIMEHTGDLSLALGENNDPPTHVTTQPDDVVRSARRGQHGSMTWFEEMLDGSHLGRMRKTRRGVGASADGRTNVSWEVTEYRDEDTDVVMTSIGSGSKRKIEDVVDDTKV